MVKSKNGTERPQKVYIKKSSGSGSGSGHKRKTTQANYNQIMEGMNNVQNVDGMNGMNMNNQYMSGYNNMAIQGLSQGGNGEIDERERKMTRQHTELLNYINSHMEQIRNYPKFVVSRVLKDVKSENPDIKVSYGLVKKVLEQKGLLPKK